MKMTLPFQACLLIGASCVFPTLAENQETYDKNWPQWRGPAGNGIVLHGAPPLEWNEEKNVKWKVKIDGKGHATPAIWGNKVFVLTAVPSGEPVASAPQPERTQRGASGNDGQRRRGGGFGRRSAPNQEHTFKTICLDRESGKVVWEKIARKEIPHQGIQSSNSFSSGSPVTDGQRVYVSFGSSGLYCYDMDGNLVWDKDLGKVSVTFGEGSSPAVHGDSLVVIQDNNGDSYLYAFDKKTGKELWKKSRSERSGWTTPYFIERNGKMEVVVNGSNAVRSYDLNTGEDLWQCSGLGSNPVPMIVGNEKAIYAMSGHRNGAAIAIKLGGSGDLTGTDAVQWTITRGTPYVPSPLLYDNFLYFLQRTGSQLSCVDPESGEFHYAQQRLEGISGVYASPLGVADRVYLVGQNGTTVVVEKSKELKILATNKLDDRLDASPAVVGGELFLRGHNFLYCISEN